MDEITTKDQPKCVFCGIRLEFSQSVRRGWCEECDDRLRQRITRYVAGLEPNPAVVKRLRRWERDNP